MTTERNKPHDYRNWTLAALDSAIMYHCEYPSESGLQQLDRLLAARGKRGLRNVLSRDARVAIANRSA